jgi:hypothetical protein
MTTNDVNIHDPRDQWIIRCELFLEKTRKLLKEIAQDRWRGSPDLRDVERIVDELRDRLKGDDRAGWDGDRGADDRSTS